MNAPEWGQFGFAGFVSFDGSGNLYILEPSRPLVTVLNTRGGLLRIIGREGEGPGEFVSPSKLLVWRDGRVAVLDAGKNAFEVFGSDGAFQRSVALGGIGMIAALNRITSEMRTDPSGPTIISQGPTQGLANIFGALAAEASTSTSAASVDDRGLERSVSTWAAKPCRPSLFCRLGPPTGENR